MNKEIESFRDWFCGYEKEYVIIGGTACNILMGESGLTFRATKDLDLVLIVEALDTKFIEKFWQYIKITNYQHWNNSRTVPQFYRFSHPSSKCFPAMIELFTRKLENIELKYNHNLTPLSFEEEISSLSAILLNDDYYEFMKTGIRVVDGLSILDATHLIPFKIKAWLDLKKEKLDGKHVDMKNIKKHKNDVFRLSELLNPSLEIHVPLSIYVDIQEFLVKMQNEDVDLIQLKLRGRTKNQILMELQNIYVLKKII